MLLCYCILFSFALIFTFIFLCNTGWFSSKVAGWVSLGNIARWVNALEACHSNPIGSSILLTTGIQPPKKTNSKDTLDNIYVVVVESSFSSVLYPFR